MKELKTSSFKNLIQESSPVLVEFWATWCSPCKAMLPVLEKLEPIYKNITFAKVNIEECREISSQYGISSVPTIIIFDNAAPAQSFIGLKTEKALKSILDEWK